MRKVLLVEYSKSFIEDINRSLLINERNDISITAIEDINQVENYLASSSYDVVVIYAALSETRDLNLNIPVRSYARKVTDVEISEKHHIKCFGIINRSTDLFNCILEDNLSDTRIPNTFEDSERPTNVLTQADLPEQFKSNWQTASEPVKKKEQKVKVPVFEVKDENTQSSKILDQFEEIPQTQSYQPYQNNPLYQNTNSNNQQNTQQSYQQESQQTYQQDNSQYEQQTYNTQNTQETAMQYPAVQQKRYSYTPSYEGQAYAYIEQSTGYAVYEVVERPPQPAAAPNQPQYSYSPSYQGQVAKFVDPSGRPVFEVVPIMQTSNVIDVSNIIDAPQNNVYGQPQNTVQSQIQTQQHQTPVTDKATPQYNNEAVSNQPKSDVQKLQYKVTDRFKKEQEQNITQAKNIATEEYERDMGMIQKDAKCITVYSAKGGVGKTTIACELASLLALTKHNRGHYKVCIADFNIDFGDVMNTLAFDEHGATMTTWAEDIKLRIQRGEKPEDIEYSAAEISIWLQKKEETGLYALLAPTSNVDSMNIKEDEISVMVNNLIKNGGFDFVICDTGNNTRDSSFISLEKADNVLLVVTQDINTAHCNISFLKTAERVGFDMNKINLVINLVRPAKIVGFEASDLEQFFRNEKTGRPYQFKTLAKIKHNNEVVLSGNNGIPLIYNTSHEFTHSIGDIARNITGEEHILAVPEKKESLFDRMFKKK